MGSTRTGEATGTTQGQVVVRRPGEGPATWAMASLFEHVVLSAETGGGLEVSVVTQPAGIAPPLHVHNEHSEAFYLLEGGMRYRAGDDVHDLSAGDFVHLPAGVPHAFRVGRTGVRYLALGVPGHLMALYDEVGVPAKERRLPVPGQDGWTMAEEIARWNEIAPRYGLVVLGPPLPEEAAGADRR